MNLTLEEATQTVYLIEQMGLLDSLIDHARRTRSREEMAQVIYDHLMVLGIPPPVQLRQIHAQARSWYTRELSPLEFADYIYRCLLKVSQHNEARMN